MDTESWCTRSNDTSPGADFEARQRALKAHGADSWTISPRTSGNQGRFPDAGRHRRPRRMTFSGEASTRLRYGMGFACLRLNSLPEHTASPRRPEVSGPDLDLDGVGDLNWVFAAFTLAYALFKEYDSDLETYSVTPGADSDRVVVVSLYRSDRPDRIGDKPTGGFKFGCFGWVTIASLAVLIVGLRLFDKAKAGRTQTSREHFVSRTSLKGHFGCAAVAG